MPTPRRKPLDGVACQLLADDRIHLDFHQSTSTSQSGPMKRGHLDKGAGWPRLGDAFCGWRHRLMSVSITGVRITSTSEPPASVSASSAISQGRRIGGLVFARDHLVACLTAGCGLDNSENGSTIHAIS